MKIIYEVMLGFDLWVIKIWDVYKYFPNFEMSCNLVIEFSIWIINPIDFFLRVKYYYYFLLEPNWLNKIMLYVNNYIQNYS